jgi:putative hydrolase of the HAD superfamily
MLGEGGSWGNRGFPHTKIGVPRFELGTSPTRTERATRLRHTPSRDRVAASRSARLQEIGAWLYPRLVLKAVLFDVDFTLFRPGPELGPEGYRRAGERHGLALDPDRYAAARIASIETLSRERDLVHDEEVWIAFTEQIIRGMGGDAEGARECAIDMVRAWERHENFSLYEDALPALAVLRRHGLRIGLVSNGQRDLDEFAAHHALDVDAIVGSKSHGRTKPHPSIFVAALQALDARPEEAAMVGDSYEDDIEGARALGMRAVLLDRDDLHQGEPDRIDTLLALPAALGLAVA